MLLLLQLLLLLQAIVAPAVIVVSEINSIPAATTTTTTTTTTTNQNKESTATVSPPSCLQVVHNADGVAHALNDAYENDSIHVVATIFMPVSYSSDNQNEKNNNDGEVDGSGGGRGDHDGGNGIKAAGVADTESLVFMEAAYTICNSSTSSGEHGHIAEGSESQQLLKLGARVRFVVVSDDAASDLYGISQLPSVLFFRRAGSRHLYRGSSSSPPSINDFLSTLQWYAYPHYDQIISSFITTTTLAPPPPPPVLHTEAEAEAAHGESMPTATATASNINNDGTGYNTPTTEQEEEEEVTTDILQALHTRIAQAVKRKLLSGARAVAISIATSDSTAARDFETVAKGYYRGHEGLHFLAVISNNTTTTYVDAKGRRKEVDEKHAQESGDSSSTSSRISSSHHHHDINNNENANALVVTTCDTPENVGLCLESSSSRGRRSTRGSSSSGSGGGSDGGDDIPLDFSLPACCWAKTPEEMAFMNGSVDDATSSSAHKIRRHLAAHNQAPLTELHSGITHEYIDDNNSLKGDLLPLVILYLPGLTTYENECEDEMWEAEATSSSSTTTTTRTTRTTSSAAAAIAATVASKTPSYYYSPGGATKCGHKRATLAEQKHPEAFKAARHLARAYSHGDADECADCAALIALLSNKNRAMAAAEGEEMADGDGDSGSGGSSSSSSGIDSESIDSESLLLNVNKLPIDDCQHLCGSRRLHFVWAPASSHPNITLRSTTSIELTDYSACQRYALSVVEDDRQDFVAISDGAAQALAKWYEGSLNPSYTCPVSGPSRDFYRLVGRVFAAMAAATILITSWRCIRALFLSNQQQQQQQQHREERSKDYTNSDGRGSIIGDCGNYDPYCVVLKAPKRISLGTPTANNKTTTATTSTATAASATSTSTDVRTTTFDGSLGRVGAMGWLTLLATGASYLLASPSLVGGIQRSLALGRSDPIGDAAATVTGIFLTFTLVLGPRSNALIAYLNRGIQTIALSLSMISSLYPEQAREVIQRTQCATGWCCAGGG